MVPVFCDNRVIGSFENGVFFQVMHSRSIYRRFNAKGMDWRVHQWLKSKGCRKWRIEFRDTKRVLEIPFERIEISGFLHDVGGGIAKQWLVNLDLFDELQPAMQRRMI